MFRALWSLALTLSGFVVPSCSASRNFGSWSIVAMFSKRKVPTATELSASCGRRNSAKTTSKSGTLNRELPFTINARSGRFEQAARNTLKRYSTLSIISESNLRLQCPEKRLRNFTIDGRYSSIHNRSANERSKISTSLKRTSGSSRCNKRRQFGHLFILSSWRRNPES